jgi:hypothetical protein
VTPEVAEQLFRELKGATLPGTDTPVPFHYPSDGCAWRAHIMASLLTQKGYGSYKIFAVSGRRSLEPLSLNTKYAGDNALPNEIPRVGWWYHVAPTIEVITKPHTSVTKTMVLDPSMADRPLPIDEWLGMMTPDAFAMIREPQALQLTNASTGVPGKRNVAFSADRNAVNPEDAGRRNTSREAEKQYAEQEDRMRYYAKLAEHHEVAAKIRDSFSAPEGASSVLPILQTMHQQQPTFLARFFGRLGSINGSFPTLLDELYERLPHYWVLGVNEGHSAEARGLSLSRVRRPLSGKGRP